MIVSALVLAGSMTIWGCTGSGSSKDTNDAAKGEQQTEQTAQKANGPDGMTKEGVEVTADTDRVRAVKDGAPFTGEIWSDDGKTYVMKFKDGKSYEGTLYHKNGKPAMVQTDDGLKCYDEDGSEMGSEEFTLKYFNYMEEAGEQIEGVFSKMKNMK